MLIRILFGVVVCGIGAMALYVLAQVVLLALLVVDTLL